MNRMRNEKEFYKKIVTITLPIVIQNLLSAAVSSADVIMLNYVGQSSLSAASLATQFASVLFMIYYGLGTGVSMLGAQYWGKGDKKSIEQVEGIALRFSIVIGIIVAACAIIIPEYMMRIFTNEEELIQLGSSYLRVVSISYLGWSIAEIYMAVLRSIGKVGISTMINAMTLGINVGLNAVFIFGLFGAPKLGIVGVALATSISRVAELLVCIVISAKMNDVRLRFSAIFEKNELLLKDFIQMSLPAVANDMLWGMAFSMYSVIMGHLGSDVVAANSIVVVVRNFGTILCYGIGSASGIIIGQMLGSNDLEEAKKAGHRFLALSILAGIAGGIVVFFTIPFVMDHAAITEKAHYYLKYMLYMNTYYITGTAVNTTLIAGVFRAGGDSKFGFVCDTIDMWVYAVPLGFLAAFVLKLPVLWVYFLLMTDEFVKWPWVFKNYFSYRWVRNITRD